MGLRRTLKNLLGYKDPDPFANICYSQEGEDMVLNRIFSAVDHGFFVDVGAHHPVRFSNTYKFYQMGWRGINIDAMPGSMEPFAALRPLDINLEIPVTDKAQVLPFYIFNETALNTFSKEMADERSLKPEYEVKKVLDVQTQTLGNINFLSIDAEGYDFQILCSNNWKKYRPDIVLVESDMDHNSFINSDMNAFMQEQGYDFYAKTVLTYFYKSKTFKA
jgi:hypothetical protein